MKAIVLLGLLLAAGCASPSEVDVVIRNGLVYDGLGNPPVRADVALVGDESEVGAALDRLRDMGVTDFNAAVMPVEEGAGERTLEFLKSRL